MEAVINKHIDNRYIIVDHINIKTITGVLWIRGEEGYNGMHGWISASRGEFRYSGNHKTLIELNNILKYEELVKLGQKICMDALLKE